EPRDNYFQRVRDSFVVISHSFLRSLFYPRAAPKLYIEATIESGLDHNRSIRDATTNRICSTAFVRGNLVLCNTGSATARNIFVRILLQKGFRAQEGGAIVDTMRAEGGAAALRCGELHPGLSEKLCNFQWEGMPRQIADGAGRAHHIGEDIPI